MIVDRLGKEVVVGDTVAYAANTNKSAHLRIGKVLATGSKKQEMYDYATQSRTEKEIFFIQVFVDSPHSVKPWYPVSKPYKMRVYAPEFVKVEDK